jgi:PleD family two-component response regulator
LHGIAPANSISTSCDAGFDGNSAVNTAIAGKEAGKDMNKTTITPQEYAELKRLAEEYAKALEQAPILIVDDDNAVRDIVVRMPSANGFGVLTASDGSEALRILGQRSVDLLFTDIVMPGMDGVELAR